MSSSTPSLKLLLDENVRADLFAFLSLERLDVKKSPKGATDKFLASLSLKEHRILVTNDSDFCAYKKSQIHSVVWLRIPQYDAASLFSSFSKLISSISEKQFRSKIIVLRPGGWKIFPLGTVIE
ncbi:MAG: hypothetical protein QG620_935 [Patescibacteria group bacterium]|nr:hypothetical protein [Patescibacteria group bacterium]